jgi:hypothetical protein
VELLFRNRTPSHPPPLLLREQLTYLLFSSALLSLIIFMCYSLVFIKLLTISQTKTPEDLLPGIGSRPHTSPQGVSSSVIVAVFLHGPMVWRLLIYELNILLINVCQ